MADNNLYFGGVPRLPQVRKLEEAFPSIASMRGQIITHKQIEGIIGEKYGTSAYRSVVTSWRKRVEDATGVVIDGRGEAVGVGFAVLEDGEQVSYGIRHRKSAARHIRKAHTAIASTDVAKLNDEQRGIREHEMVVAGRIHAVMIESRKRRIAAPVPSERGVSDMDRRVSV